jgi:hypothetical protein
MKKKIFTFCLVTVMLVVSFITGFSVSKSQAIVPLGFGGHLMSWFYCDCSDSWWLFYAPMPDSSFLGGALSWADYDSMTYPYYNMLTPGVWHLGLYLPGVQGCWFYDGLICEALPVEGDEIMVGTSMKPTAFPKPDPETGANDLSPSTLNAEGATVNSLNETGTQIPGVNVI